MALEIRVILIDVRQGEVGHGELKVKAGMSVYKFHGQNGYGMQHCSQIVQSIHESVLGVQFESLASTVVTFNARVDRNMNG